MKKMVTLNPGESQVVTFAYTPGVARQYTVIVDGLTGAFIAEEGIPQPFEMVITDILTKTNKLATAYWVAEVHIQLANNSGNSVTHLIRCLSTFGNRDPDNLGEYLWTRCWDSGYQELEITLSPSQMVSVISPYYYIIPEGDYAGYEASNPPNGMYSGGTKKKYWFRVIDEYNNWGPVASAGTLA